MAVADIIRDTSLLNLSDTNDELTFLSNSFEHELDGHLHFLGLNLKKLFSSQKTSLFCHNVFSAILVQRLERYNKNMRYIETSNGLNVVIPNLPAREGEHLTSFFVDMERLLKEKKINGVSMVFYDNNAKRIVESYKFMVLVDTGEIKVLTDYNGNPIAEPESGDSFENDKKLFVAIYQKVNDYCCRLEKIKDDHVVPLFRFHFPKRSDRKEYERSIIEQETSVRFATRPTFGGTNEVSLIASHHRKRFTYAIVTNRKV
uniref:Non-structural maintenance of chromosomes element 4 n=1 Tax=Strongyloides papillosus TaxID=174720 RepID=A0A0N5BQS1_STREA